MKNQSPCIGCAFEHQQKNNEQCDNCRDRLEYNVEVGNLPKEVLQKEVEEEYRERLLTVSEAEMAIDMADLEAGESTRRKKRGPKPKKEDTKMDQFRKSILNLSTKSIGIMDEYFEGTRTGTDKVKEASAMIREGVKISNRDQVDSQVKRSQAIRLMHHIPKAQRGEYIKFTNPEVAPFLLDSPGKNKK